MQRSVRRLLNTHHDNVYKTVNFICLQIVRLVEGVIVEAHRSTMLSSKEAMIKWVLRQ